MQPAPRSFLKSPALWLFAVTFALRFYALNRLLDSPYFAPPSGDMAFYHDWALRLMRGGFDREAFYGLPGYAYCLAGLYHLFGVNLFAIGLLQSAFDATTAVLLFKCAQHAFRAPALPTPAPLERWRPEIVGVLAGLGWAFYQPSQTFTIVLMPTSWLVLAFWSCVLCIIKTPPGATWRRWLLLGLVIGAMAMIIATVLFVIPLALAAIAFFLREKGVARSAIAAVALLGGVFAGASPCWLHNYFIAHERVFLSAHSGVNFYVGNNATANGYPKIPPGLRASQSGMLQDSITMAESARGRKLQRVEVSEFWSEKARAYIREQPQAWAGLMAKKFANFWNAFQYDDLSLITLFIADGILLPGLRWGLVATFALPGAALACWRWPRARWIAAAVLLHMGALLPVFITERYRLAAAPGLLLFAGFGVFELWRWLAVGAWKSAGAYLLALATAAYVIGRPPADEELWSLDFYNTGIKDLASKNLTRAQRNLESAYAYSPNNSETNFALGNLWLTKHDPARAKQFYGRALELNPRHGSALYNLAIIAIEERNWTFAESFLNAACSLEPDDARNFQLLAMVKLQLNDLPSAAMAIERSLALQPGHPDSLKLQAEINARLAR